MIDGPIPVMALDAEGNLTDVPAPGVHYNVTTADLDAHPELNFYRVMPVPFQRVWAGDNPAATEWTVALRFDDEEQAAAYLDVLMPGTENGGV